MEVACEEVSSPSRKVAASEGGSSARKPRNSRLRILAFVAFFAVWTVASANSEGRFQQTSQSSIPATHNIDKLLGLGTVEASFASFFSRNETLDLTLSNKNIKNNVSVNKRSRRTSGRSVENRYLPVLNLTETTLIFSRDFENGNGIMGLRSGDSGNSQSKLTSDESSFENLNRKHKGFAKYLKDRVSSQSMILPVRENFERNVQSDTETRKLSFLANLKALTKKSQRTTSNFATTHIVESSTQEPETSDASTETTGTTIENAMQELEPGTESTTEAIDDFTPLPLIIGRGSVKSHGPLNDVLSRLRKLKRSTALPIQFRSKDEGDTQTVKPRRGPSSSIEEYVMKVMKDSRKTAQVRVGSLANDSIDIVPYNRTRNLNESSVQSNFILPDNGTLSTTSKPIEITVSETKLAIIATTKPRKKQTIRNEEREITDQIFHNTTTRSPPEIFEEKIQTTVPPKSTEASSTTTVATTSRKEVVVSKATTRQTPKETISTKQRTATTTSTESPKISTFQPIEIVPTTEKSEIRQITLILMKETQNETQTVSTILQRSSARITANQNSTTDNIDLIVNDSSTAGPPLPQVGPIVERETSVYQTDTAGIIVCLVILCVGILILIIGILLMCRSAKPQDTSGNVRPYSARRFSDT